MSIQEDFVVLLRDRVRSRRQRADLDAQKTAQAIQDDAVTRGRLGAGFYAVLFQNPADGQAASLL